MPLKKKQADVREESGGDDLEGYSVSSPLSSESSASTTLAPLISAVQLQTILDSNRELLDSNRTAMAALIAALPAPAAAPTTPFVPFTPKSNNIKVPAWSEEETPSEYLDKFETAVRHNGVDKSQWGTMLRVYLSGKSQAAYRQIKADILADYDAVREHLLQSLGDTPEEADRQWWTTKRKPGEAIGAFGLRLSSIGYWRLCGFETREEVVEKVLLSRFMFLLSPEAYDSVSAKDPKSAQDAARMVQDFEGRGYFSRNHLAPRREYKPYQHFKREGGSQGGNSNSSQGGSVSTESSGGKRPSSPKNSSQPSGSQEGGNRDRSEKTSYKERKPIVCYGCNKPGHIRPNCPERTRRVRDSSEKPDPLVEGGLAGVRVEGMIVDTGARKSIVRSEFIPSAAYTGKTTRLDTWKGGEVSEHKVAMVKIKVGSVEADCEVAVDDRIEAPALLGYDLAPALKAELLSLLVQQAAEEMRVAREKCQEVVVESLPIRATRAQVSKELVEEEADRVISEASASTPIPMEDMDDCPETPVDEEAQASPVETWSTLPDIQVTLPRVDGEGPETLISEQQTDESLLKVREMALKSENGYVMSQGVLVHQYHDELGDTITRVVVPKCRRQHVLQLGHSSLLAGHFGVKKTYARISRHFVWPGLSVNVKELVRGCPGCQRAANNSRAKAPLQPLPVVSEPFSRVAFDLVGPLPKTTSGYRYLLTFMCLFTKYPEAIPLKRVDNVSVLEAMMEIFSRHGFPTEILTDQGSVFMSRMTAHMCKTFEVHKIKTSPYHPQTDGALERWHACLKGMFKRSETDLKKWDLELKYMLFAYRDTPHCTTGFSPFTLLYGRDVRGPLDLLRTSWVEDVSESCSVGEWLVNVKSRMCRLAELAGDREVKAKDTMKSQYDKSSSVKSFELGSQVLVRKPGFHGKMGDSWDGPYVVVKQLSPVTYSIQVPDQPKKVKTLHSNLLREWSEPAAKIHRVMVMDEMEESACDAPSGLKLVREDFIPTAEEQRELDEVLDSFKDVLCDTPGLTQKAMLCVRTGDRGPVRNHPYGVAPRWKDEVESQIRQLEQMGIIRQSDSPWSSPMVVVKKKDGGVRLCVDYRAVNNITDPDPYLMPSIEDILNALCSAKYISKVDLNKGFHQIPVNPADIPKTAFCTPWGKFEFVVMPFGLRNGPAIFQRLMDNVLQQDGKISRVYIDDIAIFSETWSQHCQDIARVLSRLRSAGLTANMSKCQWGQTTCEFLGHVVGKGRVSPADLKVLAVRNFPTPKTKKQVRQLLGLTGYYRRFVQNYAEHTFLLTEATKKSSPDRVCLSDELLMEIDYLKDALCSLPSLTLAGPSDEFLLQTDASGVGIGAVLSVVRDQLELPVAFYSRKLQPRERKYSASELEGLAVVAAVTHFDSYLISHPFVVETDHKALVYLNSADHSNGRIARWAMKLQPYSIKIRYRPGHLNGNADALSRCF